MNSIVEKLFFFAEKNPNKFCIADETRELSYSEYRDMVLRLAGFLEERGVKRGDRVVVRAEQSVTYLALGLAIQLLGAIFVPLEKKISSEKLSSIAKRCEAVYTVENVSKIETKEKIVKYNLPKKEEICEILFSTGTTGVEKGIVLTNKNNIALAENVIYGVEMGEGNVELIPSPLNHSHGLRRYYANIYNGSSVVIMDSVINLNLFFDVLDRYGVTAIDLVPTALSIILRLTKDRLSYYKDRIDYIELGSAPLIKEDKEKIKALLKNTRIYNFYGSTESGCISIYDFNTNRDKPNCIGRATKNAEIILVDDEKREIKREVGKIGLIASRGDMNMLSYFGEEGMDTGTIYSNDEAYFDEDGDLILLGRRGDVINVGGNKVSPEEIEDVAMGFSGVIDCACVPKKDELRNEVPVIFIVAEEEKVFKIKELKERFLEKLEAYKMPESIIFIDKIPRTFNGKIIRRELYENFMK